MQLQALAFLSPHDPGITHVHFSITIMIKEKQPPQCNDGRAARVPTLIDFSLVTYGTEFILCSNIG